MRLKWVYIIGFVCLALTSKAQFMDSIKIAFTQKPTIDARFGARNSFITTRHAKILGVKVGLNYGNTIKVGVGYNWLHSNIGRSANIIEGDGQKEIPTRLTFRYISPYFEYVFYNQNKWQISVPVNIGFGTAHYNGIDNGFQSEKKFTLLYEPYMSGHYKFTRYTGIGFGVGYRLVLVGNKALNENFNSPIYVLKLKVFFSEIYKSLRRKK